MISIHFHILCDASERLPPLAAGKQSVQVGKVELEGVVPNSTPETFINVRGQSPNGTNRNADVTARDTPPSSRQPPPGNVLADSIDNSITDDSLASLIRIPGGCVEQNLATITLPLIAAIYLEKTNDWEAVGVERKAEALKYIRRGQDRRMDGLSTRWWRSTLLSSRNNIAPGRASSCVVFRL